MTRSLLSTGSFFNYIDSTFRLIVFLVLKDEKKRELKGRPHYHILLFGHDFEDKIKWKIRNGHQLYKSEKLDKIWKKGYGLIGEVTFDSAAYVARYIMKKYLGGKDIDNLDIYKGRSKEFTTMSRGGTGGLGGIGKAWIDKYGEGVYAEDRVIINWPLLFIMISR